VDGPVFNFFFWPMCKRSSNELMLNFLGEKVQMQWVFIKFVLRILVFWDVTLHCWISAS